MGSAKHRRGKHVAGIAPAYAVDAALPRSAEGVPMALVGVQRITLRARAPIAGDRLVLPFELPPARRAQEPLTREQMACGLWVVSTLPNIGKSSCSSQVAQLDEVIRHADGPVQVAYVSSDPAPNWAEVDQYHPDVSGAAFTLDGAKERDRHAFEETFGIGVTGHRRVARGLFALLDGVFVAAQVPYQQGESLRVGPFLLRLQNLLAAFGSAVRLPVSA